MKKGFQSPTASPPVVRRGSAPPSGLTFRLGSAPGASLCAFNLEWLFFDVRTKF